MAATAAQTDAGAMQSEASTGSIEPMLVDASEVEEGESRDEVSVSSFELLSSEA